MMKPIQTSTRPPATWNAGSEMPKAFNTWEPPNAARQRITRIAKIALVASATRALLGLPCVIFVKIVAQITGLTKDSTVKMAWMY